jgi:Peptidase family M28/Secretion system C-terminal sorting domain
MKKSLLVFLVCIISESFAQSTLIQQIISSVNQDSLIYFVRELSGDIPTLINNTPQTIASRNKNQPGNSLAETYIKQKLQSYNLATTIQSFSATGKNVIAVQTGNMFPNKKYIICAHFDDMPIGSIAPGADDNASGTAAVIEAARIFSHYSFPYTLVYALWDEEEQGLIGSYFYVGQAAANGDSILGVLNLDMIAWDSNADNAAEIHTNSNINSTNLKDKLIQVNSDFNIGLSLSVRNPGTTASDHSPFWANGYGAVLLIEALFGGDFNTYYHTTSDLLIHFNQTYYLKMTKLTLATLGLLAGADLTSVAGISESPTDYKLEQNYPNPFNPVTTITYTIPGVTLSGAERSRVMLKVYDVLGTEVANLVDEEKSAGNYNISFDASLLSSGVYFYTLQSGSFVETKKMILMK